MTLHRSFVRSALALALPLACACNNSSSQATPPPSLSSMRDARLHGRELGGPVGTMFRAARDLTLTDAEKTALDGLETQHQADAPRDDYKDLQVDTVAG